MGSRSSCIGGFLAPVDSGKNFNLFSDLLERGLLRQTRNGFQDPLLIRHSCILKGRAQFASEIQIFFAGFRPAPRAGFG